jgi:hypothetical protein
VTEFKRGDGLDPQCAAMLQIGYRKVGSDTVDALVLGPNCKDPSPLGGEVTTEAFPLIDIHSGDPTDKRIGLRSLLSFEFANRQSGHWAPFIKFLEFEAYCGAAMSR